MRKAYFIGIDRHRMWSDGKGITTLIAFHGCPLRCKYCLNPQGLDNKRRFQLMTPNEIINILRKDDLYFMATNGGVTFGGGEPLGNASFIKEIINLGANKWRITVETSLNVPTENLKILLPYIDEYIVDIKDMNPLIYKLYTGKDNNKVIENLSYLIDMGLSDKILCRIPLIKGFNNKASVLSSKKNLKEMGITRFDMFEYNVSTKKME